MDLFSRGPPKIANPAHSPQKFKMKLKLNDFEINIMCMFTKKFRTFNTITKANTITRANTITWSNTKT